MDLYAYFHAGSRNHGCEAIVQTTSALFDKKIKLFSFAPEEDLEYGIDKFVELYKLEKIIHEIISIKPNYVFIDGIDEISIGLEKPVVKH